MAASAAAAANSPSKCAAAEVPELSPSLQGLFAVSATTVSIHLTVSSQEGRIIHAFLQVVGFYEKKLWQFKSKFKCIFLNE